MPTFTPAGDPFLVNTSIAGDQNDAANAMLTGGGLVVVWNDLASPGGRNVKGQLFDADGDKVGGEFQISTPDSVLKTPDVTALTNGGFVVTWSKHNANSIDVQAQVYDATGAKVGGEIQVNPVGTTSNTNSSVTALPNGAFAVSWVENAHDRIRLQVFDSAGNKPNSVRNVTSTTGTLSDTSMTTLANGGFVVAWQTGYGTSGGATYGANVYTKNGGLVTTVSADGASGGSSPTVTALADGGFALGRVANGMFKVQRFTSAGAANGADIVVSTTAIAARIPALLGLADGSLVVVWLDNQTLPGDTGSGLLGKVYDSNGVQDGDAFLVSPNSGSVSQFPDLAATADGGFAVTWSGLGGSDTTGNGGVLTRLYDVVPDNGPPTAVDDVVGATEDQTAIIAAAALTGNDSDPDGDPLTITGVSNALHGTVVLNGNGTVSFAPDADFNGTASFDYTIEDLAGNPATGTVTVNVAAINDPPRNLAFADGVVLDTASNGTSAGTISAFDVDGDSVTYALTDNAGGRFAIDANSGAVSVTNIALFDFDTVDEYQISVVATDSHGAAGPDTDLVVTLGRVLGGATPGDDRLTAPSDRNWYISGLDGNDTLVGKLGNDHLMGGLGDDDYFVRNAGDVVVEQAGEGYDTIRAYVDYTLGANVEELRLVSQAHVGTGNGLDNRLVGGGGGDTLNGMAGNDTLNGDAAGDMLSGGDGDDRLLGQDGTDTLFGGNGNDRLEGGDGNDSMSGEAGDDVLIGGAGRDILTGGLGADRFNFDDGDFGGNTTSTGDRILDFNGAEGDRFFVSAVDANANTGADDAFSFIGTAAFSGVAGQLNYFVQSGNTYFQGDVNGDSAADFMVRVVGVHTFTAANFVL